jgi:hypothetical protein
MNNDYMKYDGSRPEPPYDAEPESCSCAAGQWRYDVENAPKDVDLLTVSAGGSLVVAQRWVADENGHEWYGEAWRFTPHAFAEINPPEAKP